ncbi:hypothetical protein MKX01_001467 [Papaver californicum]|nr:hypothetical protein MKX01_001467 [Papaver californicum]
MASTVISSNKPRRRMCSCSPSNHPGAFRCSQHHQQTSVVVLLRNTNSSDQQSRNGRALMPPVRRSARRCWDFRPTPSRLSTMSIAT